jgi:hypothetical protein
VAAAILMSALPSAPIPSFLHDGAEAFNAQNMEAVKIFQAICFLLGLVTAIEEQVERNSCGSGLESREYGVGDSSADHVAPSIRKSWQ